MDIDRLRSNFFSKVNKNGPDFAPLGRCWDWQASRTKFGYGQMGVDRKTKTAPHVSLFLAMGVWPAASRRQGTCVCHRCDRPCCVNPEHLYVGTHLQNMRDMFGRKRDRANVKPESTLRGEDSGAAVLTEEMVTSIRLEAMKGASMCDLAKRFSIGATTANRVVLLKTWKHVATPVSHEEYLAAIGHRAGGKGHANAKLRVEDVKEIRRLHAEGVSLQELMKKYRLVHAAVSRCVRKVTWASVD